MPRTISYHFQFEDGSSWYYELNFDQHNNYIAPQSVTLRDWTSLNYCQCPHCPLKAADSPQCPVARNLDQIVEDSKATRSFVKALVTVKTPEREYRKECATQEGLRSLFGVIMAASGCPHLDWLRPLSRFHLPFSDIDETFFRVLSLQLLDQYFNTPNAQVPSCTEQISKRYRQVEQVNHAFVQRILSYCKHDADRNALSALDAFVQLFPLKMEQNFSSLRAYFTSLKPQADAAPAQNPPK